MSTSSPSRPLAGLVTLAVTILLATPSAWSQNANWPDGIADDADLSLPENMPDDPGYYHQRVEGADVVDVGGQWNLWSFVPQLWIDTGPPIRAEEIELGTGMHADRAWLLTAGNRDVVIAVLDSGAYWDNADLVYKFYLNPGELDRDGARPCVPTGFSGDPLDVNADGIFNIADYEAFDEECGFDIDAEGNDNGRIDPQDLIGSSRYADGVDTDANGYIDDISGWDFFWNDNDAYDEVRFGHGNGEARDSGAQGNNGIGDIGVCPECTILMVRVGDSFVTDGNDFADGVVFAVDSGASVIQEALGTVNSTSFTRQAIEYAYQNNTVVIASAADELSFHHNLPGTNNHTVYVHAIVHDDQNRARSTTFLNFNNCTNYGGQLLLSTPGGGCSSEATGKTSGQAGLVYSYALDLGLDPPLTAEEVRGLLVMGVDDIDVPESQPDNPGYDGTKFPSREGWDRYFGYGRNNARRSLELIRDGEIPPEVDIVDPDWFETVYVSDTQTEVDIVGRVGDRVDGLDPRYDSYDYELAAAAGLDPDEDDFVPFVDDVTSGLTGTLGQLDVTDFDALGPPTEPHDFAVTVRLRACVTDTGDFGDGGTCSEFRKTLFVHTDPDLHDGFPIDFGASLEATQVFYDLDEDDAEELVVASSDGIVTVLDAEDGVLDGWPVDLDNRKGHRDDRPNDHAQACAYRPVDDRGDCPTRGHVDYDVNQFVMAPPAVANLEGDEGGAAEIVVATYDGSVFAFEADGTPLDGFPVATDPAFSAATDPDNIWDEGIFGAPVLYDLDGDDDLEIIVAAMDQHVYVWHHDGSQDPGFPVYCRDLGRDEEGLESVGARIVTTPAVGDLDADGSPEIVVGSNEIYESIESRYYLIHADGNLHEDGPFEWADPDAEAPGPGRNFALLGEVLPLVGRGIPIAATLADVNGDGYVEFAIEGIGGQPIMRQWDGEEIVELRPYMNISTEAYGELSDSTDDFAYTLINHGAFGFLDPDSGDIAYVKGTAGINFGLAFASGGTATSFDHQVSAWNTRTGLPLIGFPRVVEDWQFFMSPTIVDLDDDGLPEVVNGSGGYLVRAFNYRGEELAGWPKFTGGWIIASPVVGDFDGDGFWDVATSTRSGYLYVWRTNGSTDSWLDWNGYGHDTRNTFNYQTGFPGRQPPVQPGDEGAEPVAEPAESTGDAPADAGPPDGDLPDTEPDAEPDAPGGADTTPAEGPAEDDGCCSVAAGRRGRPAVALVALAALAVVGWRRRRRRA